jgi:translation elongation factor EF-G
MFIKFTLTGLLISWLLFLVFHKEVQAPLDAIVGHWSSKSQSGTIQLTVNKNETFQCEIKDAKSKEKFFFRGNWEISGSSAFKPSDEPIDAIFLAKTDQNSPLFNHRIVKISDTEMELYLEGESSSVKFNKRKIK